jgi:CYTH domain-containing protein
MTITTIYLSAAEYEALAQLPALELRKCRYRVEEGGRPWSIDVFGASLESLILAETDFETDAELESLELPDWIERDVSDDERYTGGSLARQASSAPSS